VPFVLLAMVLAMSTPGDATRLAPDPAPSPPAGTRPVTPGPEPPIPVPLPPQAPVIPLAPVGAAVAALAAGLRRTRTGAPVPGDAAGLTGEPLVVFVPGHGNTREAFTGLAGLMELGPEDYRVFDYRWVVGTASHVHASQAAGIDGAADALNAYLAGLADGGRDLYLVGFSKGGAAIAEMLARWDGDAPGPVPGVIGAALLDPPIAGGFQGTVQSLGRAIGPIPDDGGYRPVRCDWTGLRCHDTREHLGRAAGVEVVVLRNPKAGITNFDERPNGLRIYDVPDDGPGPLAALAGNPFTYPWRTAQAHEAVLSDRRVADCIRAEMAEPGSCHIPRPAPGPGSTGGGGGGGGGGGAFAVVD
jgi:hypothetical protein